MAVRDGGEQRRGVVPRPAAEHDRTRVDAAGWAGGGAVGSHGAAAYAAQPAGQVSEPGSLRSRLGTIASERSH
jgi:hypothetical protein